MSKKTYSFSVFILILSFNFYMLNADVWVYPGASENLKSEKYYVRIIQEDNVYESFVYRNQNTNTNNSGQLTNCNHWTNFSFNDDIIVEITKLFGDPIRFCIVRPKETRIKPEVSGHVMRIKLTKPQKLFIEINEAEEDPLFIFANPPEPENNYYSDTSVVYFSQGIHDIGENYIVRDKNVYIEGGALVRGTLLLLGNKNISVTGRGIISGINSENNLIQSKLIDFKGTAENYKIEGLTLVDFDNFNIYSEKKVDVSNVKIFGWSEDSKGIKVGDSSNVRDCFFKVDNDIITINNSGITVNNCVIWQQHSGAPFQFTCYKRSLIENIKILNNDIVRIDLFNDSIWTSDKTIINCLELNQSIINNVLIEDLRIEGNVHRLLGLNTGVGGLIKGIELKDINIEGVLDSENFISAENGSVVNIFFNNVEANYMKITNEYDAFIEKRGNVSDIKFTWKNY